MEARAIKYEFSFATHLPKGTLEGGIELLDSFWWNISYSQVGDTWVVSGGELVLLRADSREAADAFIYGLALAYSLIPTEVTVDDLPAIGPSYASLVSAANQLLPPF